MFAALGVRVTLVDKRPRLLPFVDGELIEALSYHLRERRVMLRLGEEVDRVEMIEDADGHRVETSLVSGKQIVERQGACAASAVPARPEAQSRRRGSDSRRPRPDRGERMLSDRRAPHLCGGRRRRLSQPRVDLDGAGALRRLPRLWSRQRSPRQLFPYGIYTIPEISFVGKTEEELTEQDIPYETGKAPYREIARGQIVGDSIGFVKLLFHRETRELLGVHIIGEGAVELVHIGQAVLALGGKIDYFVDTVFNYPTLAECYKNAAFDGLNRLRFAPANLA